MRVAVYGKKITKQNTPVFKQFLELIAHDGWKPVVEAELQEQLEKKAGLAAGADTFSSSSDFKSGIDIAFSIGGDCTFLRTVSFIRDSGVPILGINTGRLGFLANVGSEFLEEALEIGRASCRERV